MSMERVTISGAGSALQGVGRLSDGRAVFVSGALPGEEVDVEITRDAGRYCIAQLVRVLKPSAQRAESACAAYGACGGCAGRHMRYEATLELKEQHVRDVLERVGHVKDADVRPIIGCTGPERMRNKAEYAVTMRESRTIIGMRGDKSARIVPIADCLLQKEESVRLLKWLGAQLSNYDCARHICGLVTRVNRRGEMMAVLCADAPVQTQARKLAEDMRRALPETVSVAFCRLRAQPTHALDGFVSILSGRETIEDTLLGMTFSLSPQSFFQVNSEQAEVLYRHALIAAGLEEHGDGRVLDAYCGVGTITLAAARRAAMAVGVEIVAPAVENARRNARENGLSEQTEFICGDAARVIPERMRRGERFDAALLDPPRKGADEALLKALAAAQIPRIAYVSCNPATLARDLNLLTNSGYRLNWVQPVDMFPWTEHVECVAALTRLER